MTTFAIDPVSIPLSSQSAEQQRVNDALLLHLTGFTPEQIKRFSDTEGLPLRRIGTGKGARYVLLLADFRAWASRLPRA